MTLVLLHDTHTCTCIGQYLKILFSNTDQQNNKLLINAKKHSTFLLSECDLVFVEKCRIFVSISKKPF